MTETKNSVSTDTLRDRLLIAGTNEIGLHGIADFCFAAWPHPAILPAPRHTSILKTKRNLFLKSYDTSTVNGSFCAIRFYLFLKEISENS